jgi:hypothetical protein
VPFSSGVGLCSRPNALRWQRLWKCSRFSFFCPSSVQPSVMVLSVVNAVVVLNRILYCSC